MTSTINNNNNHAGFACSHDGCDYVGATAAKTKSHERSMNAHTGHFEACKATCGKCGLMLAMGEWSDLSAYSSSSFGGFDFGAGSFDFGVCGDGGGGLAAAAVPMAAASLSSDESGPESFACTTTATTAASAASTVDFLVCSHVGCEWRSSAAEDYDKRVRVLAHERSVGRHRAHCASSAESCDGCQALLRSGAWTRDPSTGLIADVGAGKRVRAKGKKRAASAMLGSPVAEASRTALTIDTGSAGLEFSSDESEAQSPGSSAGGDLASSTATGGHSPGADDLDAVEPAAKRQKVHPVATDGVHGVAFPDIISPKVWSAARVAF